MREGKERGGRGGGIAAGEGRQVLRASPGMGRLAPRPGLRGSRSIIITSILIIINIDVSIININISVMLIINIINLLSRVLLLLLSFKLEEVRRQ